MTQGDAWLHGLSRFGIRLGLERTERLMERLGHPEGAAPAVHVAGTNGKGSTARLTAGGLMGAGLTVGLTTSPDLGDWRERVQVNNVPIADAMWQSLVAEVAEAAAGMEEPPTQFEALTALAFRAFHVARVDVMVVEVGLGGRYDATNVLPAPLVTAITPIALDHQAVLGSRLEQIAGDKAGVIKAGSPVVSAPQAPPVRHILTAAAQAQGTPIRWANPHLVTHGREGVTIRIGREVVATRLMGRHQAVNLAVAWEALRVALTAWPPSDPIRVRAAVAATEWPARLEWIPGRPPLLLDAAHNLHGARALAQALAEPYLRGPWHLVFGCFTDKPGSAMLRTLLPHVASVVLTRPQGPRGQNPEAFLSVVPTAWRPTVVDDPVAALAVATQRAADGDGVLASGSMEVVGPIRRARQGTGRR